MGRTVCAASLVLLLLTEVLRAAAQETVGCFYYPTPAGSYVWTDLASSTPVNGSDPQACQRLCAASDAACAGFSFYPHSTLCYLASGQAVLSFVSATATAISGPRKCDQVPSACTATPNATWPNPGALAGEPFFVWSGGGQSSQLPKLMCWPRVPSAAGGFALAACPATQVVATLGACNYPEGPTAGVQLNGTQTCLQACASDPLCSSFNGMDQSSSSYGACATNFGSSTACCYLGLGRMCKVPDPAAQSPRSGQRIQQGDVRVLYNFPAGQKFQPRVFDMMENVFKPTDAVPQEGLINSCRQTCYSYLGCSYWQYTVQDGCWIDTSKADTDYVMLGMDLVADANSVAGEYIQHTCSSTPAATASVPLLPAAEVPEAPSFNDKGKVFLAATLLVAAIVTLCLGCFLIRRMPDDKRKRRAAAPLAYFEAPYPPGFEHAAPPPHHQAVTSIHVAPGQSYSLQLPVHMAQPFMPMYKYTPREASSPVSVAAEGMSYAAPPARTTAYLQEPVVPDAYQLPTYQLPTYQEQAHLPSYQVQQPFLPHGYGSAVPSEGGPVHPAPYQTSVSYQTVEEDTYRYFGPVPSGKSDMRWEVVEEREQGYSALPVGESVSPSQHHAAQGEVTLEEILAAQQLRLSEQLRYLSAPTATSPAPQPSFRSQGSQRFQSA